MNNSPSSVDIVMAMAIFLETIRRQLRNNLKKRRANSGHKPEKGTSKKTNRAKGKGGNAETRGPSSRDYLKFKP